MSGRPNSIEKIFGKFLEFQVVQQTHHSHLSAAGKCRTVSGRSHPLPVQRIPVRNLTAFDWQYTEGNSTAGLQSWMLLRLVFFELQGENLRAALWFSILLNLKHIYLYIAPAYFVYFLRSYCIETGRSRCNTIHWTRLFKLAFIVITVCAVSFGPFIGQIEQVGLVSSGFCSIFVLFNF